MGKDVQTGLDDTQMRKWIDEELLGSFDMGVCRESRLSLKESDGSWVTPPAMASPVSEEEADVKFYLDQLTQAGAVIDPVDYLDSSVIGYWSLAKYGHKTHGDSEYGHKTHGDSEYGHNAYQKDSNSSQIEDYSSIRKYLDYCEEMEEELYQKCRSWVETMIRFAQNYDHIPVNVTNETESDSFTKETNRKLSSFSEASGWFSENIVEPIKDGANAFVETVENEFGGKINLDTVSFWAKKKKAEASEWAADVGTDARYALQQHLENMEKVNDFDAFMSDVKDHVDMFGTGHRIHKQSFEDSGVCREMGMQYIGWRKTKCVSDCDTIQQCWFNAGLEGSLEKDGKKKKKKKKPPVLGKKTGNSVRLRILMA